MTLVRPPNAGAGSSLRPGLSLVAVIGTYPLPTTTFIDRELEALRGWGADVRVVAVRRPPAPSVLSTEQRLLARSVHYLLPVDPRALVRAHVRALTRHPVRSLSTLVWLLTRPHPSFRARAKSALHFGEGVYMAEVCRGQRVDELHAHFIDRAATIALVAGRLLGTPYSLSVHAGADLFVAPVLVAEKVGHARRVVTCTEHNRSRLCELAGEGTRAKISVVHHGLDLERYRPAQDGPRDGPSLILSVGQLKERKGFSGLIEACALLRDRGVPFTCSIVGDGPQLPELQRLIHERQLDRIVTLKGALPHDRVVQLFGSASVFALPCVRTVEGDVDGIPNVLAEAMALGVPVVSTTLPAIRELVSDGVDGSLVPPGDEGALADALQRLLEDPSIGRAQASQARHTVRGMFNVDENVAAFAEALWPGRVKVSPTRTNTARQAAGEG
jgi:colanic acid/amylovoran biosynthesis glycosyltransferase